MQIAVANLGDIGYNCSIEKMCFVWKEYFYDEQPLCPLMA